MKNSITCNATNHAGFISTRLAGTDGVSLETTKWARIFEKEGYNCFYFAGELDRPENASYLLEEAHFRHPVIKEIYVNSFHVTHRPKHTTELIHEYTKLIKEHLYRFIDQFQIDLLVIENAITIPLNIPLGMAITELIAESGILTIAHHHDFFWERQRFKTNAVWDYLNMAFPPNLPQIQHVVINSSGDHQLSLRTGISPAIIPNVMDFDHSPPPPDDYASDVRKSLGIDDDELLILQPTRVIKRKGIEHAIELVNRLGMKAKLVISHASGDEGYDYEQRLKDYSKLLNVKTVFVSGLIQDKRGYTDDGQKIYTLYDVYPSADLVTYPSNFEGFGNAFLEAIYFRKPIVVSTYSIYEIDIKPKGFSVIEIDGYVSESAVLKTREVLSNPSLRKQMAEHNYEAARRSYSYSVLEDILSGFIKKCTRVRAMPLT